MSDPCSPGMCHHDNELGCVTLGILILALGLGVSTIVASLSRIERSMHRLSVGGSHEFATTNCPHETKTRRLEPGPTKR